MEKIKYINAGELRELTDPPMPLKKARSLIHKINDEITANHCEVPRYYLAPLSLVLKKLGLKGE